MKIDYRLIATNRLKVILLSFCLWSSAFGLQSVFAAEPKSQFQQANELYRAGQFEEASKIFTELSQQMPYSSRAAIYFNLGNSEYRAGKLNSAILSYERALGLNPWYADARYNLNAARTKIEYKIEDRRNPFIRIHDLALKWFKLSQYAGLALFLLLLFLVSTALWLRPSVNEQFWAFPRAETFAIFLFVAVLFGCKFFYQSYYAEAIVIANEAEVRYGPSMDNQSLMKLGGGLKVFIVDAREDWSRVVTWNGETGWIKNSELGRVNL